jgi:hypothetical protein
LEGRKGRQLPSPSFCFVIARKRRKQRQQNYRRLLLWFFYWKVEEDGSFLFLFCYNKKKKKGMTALLPSPFSSSFLEGRKGRQLPSPSFCFVLLQQEAEEGDGNFVAVTFFSCFFWKAKGDTNCRPLLFVLFCCSKKKKKVTTTLLPLPFFSSFF